FLLVEQYLSEFFNRLIILTRHIILRNERLRLHESSNQHESHQTRRYRSGNLHNRLLMRFVLAVQVHEHDRKEEQYHDRTAIHYNVHHSQKLRVEKQVMPANRKETDRSEERRVGKGCRDQG